MKTTRVSPKVGGPAKAVKPSESVRASERRLLKNRAWVERTPDGLRAVAQAGHMRLTLDLVGFHGKVAPKDREQLESLMQDSFGQTWESLQGDGAFHSHAWVDIVPVLAED